MPDVNLSPLDAQQAAINRRRQLAAILQQQGLEPLQASSVPGAKISPWEGIAKLAQGLIGGIQNNRLDKQQAELSGKQQSAREQQYSQLAQAMVPRPQGGSITLPAPSLQSASLPDLSGGQVPAAPPQDNGLRSIQLPVSKEQVSTRDNLIQSLVQGLSSTDPSLQNMSMAALNQAVQQGALDHKTASEALKQVQEFNQQMQMRRDDQEFKARESSLDREHDMNIAGMKEAKLDPLSHVNVMVDGKPSMVLADNHGNFFDIVDKKPIEGRITPYIAPVAPRQRGEITPTAEAGLIQNLSGQWTKSAKDVQDLYRANTIMQTGMQAARRGDMNAGSQAVLVTFQKFLDPSSVVRESEYARSGAGQAMANQIRGYIDKLENGGAGMTLPELEKFSLLAQEIVTNLSKEGASLLSAEKKRIASIAERFNVPVETIIPAYDYSVPGGKSPDSGTAIPAVGGTFNGAKVLSVTPIP